MKIKEMFKDFGKNFKFYIDYILKLDFGELLIKFFELVIVVLLALIMYIPVYLIREFIYSVLSLLGNYSVYVNLVIDILINGCALVVCILCFIYFFNRRFEDLQKEIKNKEEITRKEKTKKVEEELDLPIEKK